jgi:hypothetical protein
MLSEKANLPVARFIDVPSDGMNAARSQPDELAGIRIVRNDAKNICW